jgi:hypothetical protein
MGLPVPQRAAPSVSPFRKEAADFVTFMIDKAYDGTTDPLKVWPQIEERFPTLARFALKVFAVSATSGDIERFFSHTGDVCTPDRSLLAPETINMLSTCNMYLRRKLGIFDSRNKASLQKSLKFAFLNAELEAENPTDLGAYYALVEAAGAAAEMDEENSDD